MILVSNIVIRTVSNRLANYDYSSTEYDCWNVQNTNS